MKYPILEKPIVPVMNPTENQKAVMSKIVAADTPKTAAADISKNPNLVSARDMLKKLGMITLDDEGAALTEAGTKTMTDQGLVDEMGELTDTGKKAAFGEKEAQDEEMPMEMIKILRTRAITESLNKVPEKLLNQLSSNEQKQLLIVIGGKKEFLDAGFEDLWEKVFTYFLDTGDMPYGIAKARTGDPDQWVLNQLT